MTDCPNGDVRDLLPDLLHERLGPVERDIVRTHVAGCATCQAELALLGELRAAMHRAPAVNVPAVVASLPTPSTPRTPQRGAWMRWRAAAAVLVLAGGTGYVVTRAQPDAAPAHVAVAPAIAPLARDVKALPERAAVSAPAHELPVASSAVNDLTDRELTSLLGDIESLDGLPSAEVESAPELLPAGRQGGE